VSYRALSVRGDVGVESVAAGCAVALRRLDARRERAHRVNRSREDAGVRCDDDDRGGGVCLMTAMMTMAIVTIKTEWRMAGGTGEVRGFRGGV